MIEIKICRDADELGKIGADIAAAAINQAITERGYARIVLSTGASQFTTLANLVSLPIDWSKVELFHLDEYIGLPETHPASFRKYLRERVLAKTALWRKTWLVDGNVDSAGELERLSQAIREAPIDIGLIGIGQNAHIAFNDPPADFQTRDAYRIVELDEACKRQQVSEGWFATTADVPKTAISMTVYQIMQCRIILSCVPYAGKAKAVADTLARDLSPAVPATMLKTHPDFRLLLDRESAAGFLKSVR